MRKVKEDSGDKEDVPKNLDEGDIAVMKSYVRSQAARP